MTAASMAFREMPNQPNGHAHGLTVDGGASGFASLHRIGPRLQHAGLARRDLKFLMHAFDDPFQARGRVRREIGSKARTVTRRELELVEAVEAVEAAAHLEPEEFFAMVLKWLEK